VNFKIVKLFKCRLVDWLRLISVQQNATKLQKSSCGLVTLQLLFIEIKNDGAIYDHYLELYPKDIITN